MKFLNIALLFVIFAVACSLTFAQDEPSAKRIALRRPVGKAVKTSTTTAAPPPSAEGQDGDYADENPEEQYSDEGDEASHSSTTTTTTEAPKRIGPVIRPFRSNDDFLNSLKRRQMNAKKHRDEKPVPKIKQTQVAENGGEAEESAPAPAPAPTKSFKGNPALSRRKFTKPGKAEAQPEDAGAEEPEQEEKEDFKPKRPQGRLALRRRT
ncbi:nucleolin 2-like [Teleopsis dalmanni]|uniref:nucleolin 2-like n=1 Tax=Teleopsis dalmanni TaxID=139649 RepID=UPI0018CE0532|nr:nucleolin 2-like [Teleopsis dalmanni]XP_037936930.1 nucleolin 2-like [Teleopsis dalmanni]